MVPSTGIEPVAFPMSRERATAAPTGLKFFSTTQIAKLCYYLPSAHSQERERT